MFDSRGHSAIWGRYVLMLNPSGLIISYANVNKRVEGACYNDVAIVSPLIRSPVYEIRVHRADENSG